MQLQQSCNEGRIRSARPKWESHGSQEGHHLKAVRQVDEMLALLQRAWELRQCRNLAGFSTLQT